MFPSSNSPSKAYANIGIETGVMSASPHKLILMLFDGALLSIAKAAHCMQAGQIAEKGQAVSRAIDIIDNALKASLDYKAGGELAGRLGSLYDYITSQLLQANLHNDVAALDEASRLLRELKTAWEEIANDPAVLAHQANKPAA